MVLRRVLTNNSHPPDRNRLPRHVAIIMDGNGRWAQRQGLLRIRGHVVGVESVRVIARLARKLGISYLTLFAFSEENWQRPALEIRVLMALLRRYLHRELPEMQDNQIALNAIGNLQQLPEAVQRDLAQTMRSHRPGGPDGPDPGPELRRPHRDRPGRPGPGPGGAGRTPPTRSTSTPPCSPATSTPPTCPTRTS